MEGKRDKYQSPSPRNLCMSPRNTKLIFNLILALGLGMMGGTTMSMCQNGSLLGSAVFVNDRDDVFIEDAANVLIELEHNGQIIVIVSGEAAELVRNLPTGTYCLHAARDNKNVSLQFSEKQHKCFIIKPGKVTRFDIGLLKPKSEK